MHLVVFGTPILRARFRFITYYSIFLAILAIIAL